MPQPAPGGRRAPKPSPDERKPRPEATPRHGDPKRSESSLPDEPRSKHLIDETEDRHSHERRPSIPMEHRNYEHESTQRRPRNPHAFFPRPKIEAEES